MNRIEINKFDSLYDITEKYPETVSVFVNNGMTQMKDENKRKSLGKNIKLYQFIKIKNKNPEYFMSLLENAVINKQEQDTNKFVKHTDNKTINITGLLPCPVRLPVMNSINELKTEFENKGIKVITNLKAASTGTEWIENNLGIIEDEKQLPDIFVSAGFELFFDKNYIGKFCDKNVFEDKTGFKKLNDSFIDIDLKDPKNQYSIISVVPAVFLVNTEELGNIDMPVKWSDLFKPEFKNRVSLPVGDFDLFNALLLHIHKFYGEEGIKKLSESFMDSLHPAEMVKTEHKQKDKPIVTIMPNFFTKMVNKTSKMKAVWPEDGSIISPIFMLTKKSGYIKSKKFIELFSSKQVGEILAHNGLFPSVNPEVDNRLDKTNKFLWLGWDYIYNNDITELIKKCNNIFNTK